ncbi:hypothetical protein PCC7418_3306 [Halothece sp. PCC 7418]|uniref:hypothetical protein n=1 Tax=Halothece sp. (strain PCC 7418) TaxID=65093 RepID=UPI0002A0665F|nr:hypothetical protein [Halothece sp. PCC 7418]AFZ45421.1 hypothetical protein PCC7418_3306 [Halothece sp. PCC 7418]
MATNTIQILTANSPEVVPVTEGFFIDFAGTQDSTRIFNIEAGAGAENLDPGAVVNLTGPSSSFDYARNGSTLVISDGDGNISAEILANPNQASTVTFDDLVTSVEVVNNEIVFGGLSFADGDEFDGAETDLSSPTFEITPDGDDAILEEGEDLTFTVTSSAEITTSLDYSVGPTGVDPTTPFDFDGGVNPSGVVELTDGEGTFTITAEDDDLDEVDETFQVVVNPLDLPDQTLATATGTIPANDAPPGIALPDLSDLGDDFDDLIV